MAWATPAFTKGEVNRAGQALLTDADELTYEELQHSYEVINNWRSSHSFPLNTFQATLRRKARDVDGNALVAQRLKRLSSIELKLRLMPKMNLSQMQDIGGCRAVVGSVVSVDRVVKSYKNSELRHELLRTDDYIRAPRKSGYRSIHLIYRYQSDRKHTYDGLLIEMQIRSQLQHAWATAVETMGTFLRQALKSSQGEAEWLRFFALMGSALAVREKTSLVPETPTKAKALISELRQLEKKLDVSGHLSAYGAALRATQTGAVERAHYYLLELTPATQSTTITAYQITDLPKAQQDYLELEKRISGQAGADAVLVSVDSLEALRRAYPNYFLDTHTFIGAVRQAIDT